MHLCICGQRLFHGQSSRDILKSNVECRIDFNLHASTYLSTTGLEFLSKLLAKEPSKRPSAHNALGHRWFNESNEEPPEKASNMSELWELSSCDVHSCCASCDDCQVDRNDHNGNDNVPNSDPERETERNKPSIVFSFKGLLRRRGYGRASTLAKIVPAQAEKRNFQGHDSASRGSSPGGHRSHKNLASRASQAVAWMRRKPDRQSYVLEKNLPVRRAPVVSIW